MSLLSSPSPSLEGQVPFESNTGANNYVYFVSPYLGGPFSQLPFVTPGQVKAARQVKKFLTGRLESPVSTYPAFPGERGREKNTVLWMDSNVGVP